MIVKLNRKQLKKLIYESLSNKPKDLTDINLSIDDDVSVDNVTLEELLIKYNELKTAATTLWENQQMIYSIVNEVLDPAQLLNAIEKFKLKGKFDKRDLNLPPTEG